MHNFAPMKKLITLVLFITLFVFNSQSYSQSKNYYVPPGGARLMVQINGTDTILLAFIHDIYVFPRPRFKNKAQEEFYWRTVRDVKKTLPFAKLIASEITKTNMKLVTLPNDKVRKQYLNQYEKEVFRKYEADLKKMTINQGRLLLKLVDRECEQTSYELIKIYRGGVTAFFWQGVARVFGSNLKESYNASDKDKILERVILLVEAGQI